MPVIQILYIILGLSIGVGVTLIFLQEKFVRERQRLIALGKAEKGKSADLLKKLDSKWEHEVFECRKQIEAKQAEIDSSIERINELKGSIKELEDSLKEAGLKEAKLVESAASAGQQREIPANNEELEAERGKNKALNLLLATKETEFAELKKDRDELAESLKSRQAENNELYAEIDVLKGKINALNEELKKQEQKKFDDDDLIMAPGKHYLPASVARSLMRK